MFGPNLSHGKKQVLNLTTWPIYDLEDGIFFVFGFRDCSNSTNSNVSYACKGSTLDL